MPKSISRKHNAHWKAEINGVEHRFKYDPTNKALYVWQRHAKKKRILTNDQIALLAVEDVKKPKAEDARQTHLPFESEAA